MVGQLGQMTLPVTTVQSFIGRYHIFSSDLLFLFLIDEEILISEGS